MAKSFERPVVDKLERKRKARLENVQRQRKIEKRDFHNLTRIGWKEIFVDTDEQYEFVSF